MDRLFSFIGDVADPVKGGGDTFTDRLNCRHTPCIFIILALVITTKQYVGTPIACWCPDHFTHAQVDYTNQVCWVYNTYYLPYDENIPKRGEPRNTIGYYQWVSLLLCTMGVCFYLPRIMWIALNTKSGIAVTTITDAAVDYQRSTDFITRSKTMRFMKKHMGTFLRELSITISMAGKTKSALYKLRFGNYLVTVLLFVKLCYLLNVIMQIMMLNFFLRSKYTFYGYDIIERIFTGQPLSDSRRFPRVTMCDLNIRVLGSVQPYTVMCALPVNLFNEIIFIFVWFWIIIMGLCTLCSIVYWLLISVIVPHQTRFIKTRLIAMGKLGAAPHHMVRSFVENYLRNDGMIIIQLVSENASDFIAAELICALWEQYRDKADAKKKDGQVIVRASRRKQVDNYDGDDVDDDKKENYKYINPETLFSRYKTNVEESESESENERTRYDSDDEGEDSEGDGPSNRFRPPVPSKPNREEVGGGGPISDTERLRKEKLLKERRERDLKEFRRGDRKHLRSGYR